jgi:hypothetical protein
LTVVGGQQPTIARCSDRSTHQSTPAEIIEPRRSLMPAGLSHARVRHEAQRTD